MAPSLPQSSPKWELGQAFGLDFADDPKHRELYAKMKVAPELDIHILSVLIQE